MGLLPAVPPLLLSLVLLATPFWRDGDTAAASESLVINTYAIPPFTTEEATGFLDNVVREAGRRIGHDITIVSWPEKRGIRLANSGKEDGHFIRIASVTEEFRNLIHVPVPIYRSIYVAIAKREDVEVEGWE